MKLNKFKPFGLFILSAASLILIQFGCNKTEENENKSPTCTIISPEIGDKIKQGETVTISVDADDTDGYVTEVKFYSNNTLINTSTSFPYNYEWVASNQETGTCTIKATAKDNDGATKTDEITITIIEPPSPPTNFGCSGWCVDYNYTNGILTSATIYLHWDSSPNSTGYNIYSSSTSGSYSTTPVITTSSTSANKTYTVFSYSYTLYFVATAFNDGGESEYSNEYQRTIPSQ
ncbi:MAG: hypothetical protein KAT68_07045 [Bacteroidales bacterium]|nr:hypothetical protein [Bacteroidales bacterium]